MHNKIKQKIDDIHCITRFHNVVITVTLLIQKGFGFYHSIFCIKKFFSL